MLFVCGVQTEAGEEILGASEEALRLSRNYSGGELSESCTEKRYIPMGGKKIMGASCVIEDGPATALACS